jgi:hypothetical protein
MALPRVAGRFARKFGTLLEPGRWWAVLLALSLASLGLAGCIGEGAPFAACAPRAVLIGPRTPEGRFQDYGARCSPGATITTEPAGEGVLVTCACPTEAMDGGAR